jgi:8-oxo-dGTP pyrophosphatase MutT (NUDIX family)
MTKLPLRINAFIYTNNDAGLEFLCLKRTPDDGGFWQTVTGTVHDDESFIGTITREIQEECGIDTQNILKIEGPFFDFEWMKGEIKIREFVYGVEVSAGVGITLAPDEHDEYRWCDEKVLFETLEKENNVKAARVVLERLHA